MAGLLEVSCLDLVENYFLDPGRRGLFVDIGSHGLLDGIERMDLLAKKPRQQLATWKCLSGNPDPVGAGKKVRPGSQAGNKTE
jgi:hypothetical protein